MNPARVLPRQSVPPLLAMPIQEGLPFRLAPSASPPLDPLVAAFQTLVHEIWENRKISLSYLEQDRAQHNPTATHRTFFSPFPFYKI